MFSVLNNQNHFTVYCIFFFVFGGVGWGGCGGGVGGFGVGLFWGWGGVGGGWGGGGMTPKSKCLPFY